MSADCGHDPCQKGIWDEGWMTGLREGRAESADLIVALKDILRIARAASIGMPGNAARIAKAEAAIAKAASR